MATYPAATPTSERVLQAASELFAERGYAATTTRQIAERAGVNEVTLFRQFGNKAGILRAWAERLAAQTAGFAATAATEPSDLGSTLRMLAQLEVRSAITNGGAALRLAFEASTVPEVAEVLGEGPKANLEGLTAYMAQAQGAGELRSDLAPSVMAEAFFSLTSSVVMTRTVLMSDEAPGDLPVEDVVDQMLEIFLAGARNPDSGDHGCTDF